MTGAHRYISISGVASVVKEVAQNAGVRGQISGQSLGIGGATAALSAGLSMATTIVGIGEWRSDSVLRYIRAVGAAKIGVSQEMGVLFLRSR